MINGNQVQPAETEQSDNSLNKLRDRHKELSITVRRTMFALLAYSASCGVIIAQPDVPFVLTSSGVQIPVINVAVNLKAFLIVGPLGLIAITAYLHIFLAELNRIIGLDEYDKLPFLFNFQKRLARILSFLIFYAIPPIMMVAFSWKSAVIEWRTLMYFATMVVTAGMLLLYLKPSLKHRLRRLRFITVLFIIIGIVGLAGMAFLSKILTANLTRSLNLERAQLAEKKLRHARLTGANLAFADLTKASLSRADLSKANLSDANLSLSRLNRANLSKANLSRSRLRKAELRGADLSKANLSDADLKGARNLTVGQLCSAETLDKSILDSGLEKQVKEQCPDLLKEP
ncbi:MAG: pentapeptide repeat-containing protein [Desulfobacteraceae bacterium]|jgi:hypothetical protein